MTSTIRLTLDLSLEPSAAFRLLVDELTSALARANVSWEPGPSGRVLEDGFEVGRVVDWLPDQRVRLEWHPASWAAGETTEMDLSLDSVNGATRLVLEHRGWGSLLGGGEEIVGWFASEAAAPVVRATTPRGLGDWLTDRGARRPSGARARATYRDPLYHYPNFRVILAELALTSQDYLIEVGCGGGAFLKEALRTGCRAAAIDHSSEMVRLATEENLAAVAEGRLKVVHAGADRLPFSDGTFSAADMTGVLGFLPDPVEAFRQIHRVLKDDGRFVALGSDPALRGTPAAPEPVASRLRFYSDAELEALGLPASIMCRWYVVTWRRSRARPACPRRPWSSFVGAVVRF
jgi:SAM-dependent methyltransferase